MSHVPHGQPKGLYLLFFTELWERFGFYMLQTLLVLYLSKGLSFSDHSAYLLYGAFTSMLYVTPVIGGYIADKFIGFRQAIFIGAILLIIGYLLMSIDNTQLLFLGLSIVIIGNGFSSQMSRALWGIYIRRMIQDEMGDLRFFTWGSISAL